MSNNPWDGMDLDDYQELATRTAVYPRNGEGTVEGVTYCVMGLIGESGEIANQAKKIIRDDNGIMLEYRREKMIAELGDVLWYVAMLSWELGTNLSQIGSWNIQKLQIRARANAIHGDERMEDL